MENPKQTSKSMAGHRRRKINTENQLKTDMLAALYWHIFKDLPDSFVLFSSKKKQTKKTLES